MTLNPKQAAFVAEYLVDLNATQAAIRAGYSAHTAEQQGPRLLGNAGVAEAIQAGQKARAERVEISQDRVLRELARIALGDLRKLFTPSGELKRPEELDDDAAAMVASIEVVTVSKGEGAVEHVAKLKAWDKPRALDMLARHLGIYEADNKQANGLDKLAEVLDARRNRVRSR